MKAPNTLRVATYNIHKGVLRDFLGMRRISRIHDLRARIHELDADLIMLQEVQGHNERNVRTMEEWPAEPQDVFLARSPSLKRIFESAYGSNAHYLHGHHGNALLSRFPIVRQENRDVSDHALEKRGVLHCVLAIGNMEVHCFVVHFGLLARSRMRQTEALIDWIKRAAPPEAPLIIGGDFNDWRNRLSNLLCGELDVLEVFDTRNPRYHAARRAVYYVRDRLEGLGIELPDEPAWLERRVRSARTYPAVVPWLRMDRIYQRGFSVRDARVLRGPEWARLSDHSPLIAELVLQPQRADVAAYSRRPPPRPRARVGKQRG